MKFPTALSLTLLAAACLPGTHALAAATAKTAASATAAPGSTLPDGRQLTLVKVGETRVSRTVYDFEFRVEFKNNATALVNGTATLRGVGAGTSIVRSSVPLAAVAPNGSFTPTATLVLRHDRSLPFDTAALNWTVTDAAANQATIPSEMSAVAAKIAADPKIAALIAEQNTPAMIKSRWNQFLELVRIPAPSRFEYVRGAEIHRRAVAEWGFAPDEVVTRNDGFLPNTDVNIVDGSPVYNSCVVIKGSYSSRVDAQHYKGQYPKVLMDGHNDVVNPEVLPPASDPWNHIRLQPYSEAVVETPAQLAAINRELAFDANGRIVEDANYQVASQWFANASAAASGGGVRIYVPGYSDMMSSTSNLYVLAAAMKRHGIKPVYDIWVCGSAGEEGKGNLAGMKQLFGFDQNLGTGSNPLNFVTYFGHEGGGINFTGSHRFEMKYKAPVATGANLPSAAEAMAASIARIANVRTPSEINPQVARTTYTVGRSSCEAPSGKSTVVPSCSIEVDMRSDRTPQLNEIRSVIEPMFQAGVSAENARYGRVDGSPEAVTIELVWYGLRPAYVAPTPNNVAVHAALQSAIATGQGTTTTVSTSSGSLNDNVPANTGVPTFDLSINSNATSAGTHAFWEYGTRGNPANESARMRRVLVAVLTVAGFHAADGTIVPPATGPIGNRTREVKR